MKVVWSPATEALPPPKTYKNVWYRKDNNDVWMDPTAYHSLAEALNDREESNYKRVAILEF